LTINGSEELKEMIVVEAWAAIRYLHAQGRPIRAIARELGLSRNTVRTALREDSVPHYARPPRSNPQLEPFSEQIRQMLVDKEFIGTRILRELRVLGYEGSASALYTYLRGVKAAVKSRVIERFETPPGQQAQFDWSVYTITLAEQMVKLTLFCLTLAFNRRKFYWPSLDSTQASIFEALEAALRHFGGAPKEVLVDNARALVLEAHPEQPVRNPHFLELCGHYHLQPRACEPGRPQTKGKVERPFYYLEQQFIKGNTWADWDTLSRDLAVFTAADLDQRPHGTPGEPPIERFAREQECLTPLPPVPFIGTHELLRKVSWDCLVPYGGSRYSVPSTYAGQAGLAADLPGTTVDRARSGWSGDCPSRPGHWHAPHDPRARALRRATARRPKDQDPLGARFLAALPPGRLVCRGAVHSAQKQRPVPFARHPQLG
jgi:transposase